MLMAKSSEHGLEIQTNDSELFQRRFHAERNKSRKLGDTTFDSLRIRIISPQVLYIINGDGHEREGTGESNTEVVPRG